MINYYFERYRRDACLDNKDNVYLALGPISLYFGLVDLSNPIAFTCRSGEGLAPG
jgi:hypothetical protein